MTRLFLTLLPSFPHFARFAYDPRVAGIRFNSAKTPLGELPDELARAADAPAPVWFDVKGRQPRVAEVLPNEEYLEVRLNHPVEVETPSLVLLKGAADRGILGQVSEGGRRLLFAGNPARNVEVGDSLHFKRGWRSLAERTFTEAEIEKIQAVRAAGVNRWFLSYVEGQRDVDEMLELVGRDAQLMLKIETMAGLDYAARTFRKRDGLTLVAARGDLFVEIDRPHRIAAATKMLLERDPEAVVASRVLLSCAEGPTPSCADISELAWLRDIGCRNVMLCDDLCLHAPLLSRAVNAFSEFQADY